MKKNILITIIGPTAIGKTSLSIALAQHFDCDIISCDSRQFFKEMKIGTAVPTDVELAGAPHHFIQNKSIFENYTVGDFEKDAIAKLDELFLKKLKLYNFHYFIFPQITLNDCSSIAVVLHRD